MALDLRELGTIVSNEFRCLLRDRHTLVYSVLLPFLLYPALFIGVAQAVIIARGAQERRISRIAVLDGRRFSELTSCLEGREKVRLVPPPLDPLEGSPDAGEWIRSGKVDAVVLPREGAGGSMEVQIHFSEASDSSRTARGRIEAALDDLRAEKLKDKARELGGDEGLLDLLQVQEMDISPAGRRAWEALARVMPLLLVLMVTLGAFYPALEATVGERERGTIETTLLEPVDRTALILGKFLPVTALAILSAALNFASMGISLWVFLLRAKAGSRLEGLPLGSLLWVLATAVLLALLVSAVMMAVALYARSFKEGQSFLGAILLLVMIPGFMAAVREVHLTPLTVVTPVANLALAVRDSFLGKLDPAMGALAIAAAAIYTVLAIAIASGLARRETVLLGEPAAPSPRRGLLAMLFARR